MFRDRTSLTYRELDEQANRLAHYLIAQGVAPGVFVGVSLERTPRLPIAILAVLKAGGVYMPLDPDYPTERLSGMIAEAQCRVIVTDDLVSEWLPAGDARLISLDADEAAIAGAPTSSPGVEIAPESLAYVMYTSGSTGRPKGVLVPHGGIVNRMEWDIRSLPLLEVFHASVQAFRAARTARVDDVLRRVRANVAAEKQLVIHPTWFVELTARIPKLAGVEIQLLRGRARNEQTMFRYDVILHVGARPAAAPAVTWRDWLGEGMTLDTLASWRRAGDGAPIGVTRVPNTRVAEDLALWGRLRDAPPDATIASLAGAGAGAGWIDPEDLWQVAEAHGYVADVMYGAEPGHVDAVFRRAGAAPLFAAAPPSAGHDKRPRRLINQPLAAALGAKLLPTLRHDLQQRLPDAPRHRQGPGAAARRAVTGPPTGAPLRGSLPP